MLTFEEVRSRKRAATEPVLISDDPQLSQAFHEAEAKVADAKRVANIRQDEASLAALDEAELALEAARRDLEPHLMRFVVRAIGREAFEELIDKHQPTKDQRAKARRESPGMQLRWNNDTFPPALLAAAVAEPELSEVDAKELWTSEAWSAGDAVALFAACVQINQAAQVVDLGKGSPSTRV